jgi:hypothetical protein
MQEIKGYIKRDIAATKHIPTPFFQPKLTVNTPGDAYEQEADQVADQVMRMQAGDAPIIQRIPLTSVGDVQRQCAACEQEEEQAQRKETGSDSAGGKAAPGIVSDVLSSGGGEAMDTSTRQFMESRFSQDFSNIRIHTDSRAAESATAIQAKAYTSGRDIVFGQGQYQPESSSGKRLLAHELAHVGQQGQGGYGQYIQRMSLCPHELQEDNPTPSGWKPYHGNSCVFHCCYRGILEDRMPTPSDPQNECFYDEHGALVDTNHPYAGCGGTPNQYDSSRNPIRHALIDRGGIVRSGWGAFWTSRRHARNRRRR